MAQSRIRIVDVADVLGLSTATVSKVIHGKTEKISEETFVWKIPDDEKNRMNFYQRRFRELAESDITAVFAVSDFYALTTIHQDASYRAKTAIACLEAMRDGLECEISIVLPVELVKRESTRVL